MILRYKLKKIRASASAGIWYLYDMRYIVICLMLFGCGSTKTKPTSNNDVDVGYGKQSQDELTSPVSVVEVTNPALSLGDYLKRVPGVQVTGSGSNTRVRIRGAGSINADTGPLYVIDDVPITTEYSEVESMINVNDIKEVTVLRDISASNIYGQRAQNGVVIIETK